MIYEFYDIVHDGMVGFGVPYPGGCIGDAWLSVSSIVVV